MTPQTAVTLSELRRMTPRRALGYREAIGIAERQANRIVQTLDLGHQFVDERQLFGLTRIEVVRESFDRNNTHSGCSSYEAGRWVVRLDQSESYERQRFTFAHELKHIIDSTNQHAYQHLTDRQIERICDHFAGCLLMSKPAIYRLWSKGLQAPEALARFFRVSLKAMKVRLSIVGLPINSGQRLVHACRPASRQVKGISA